MSGLLQRQQRLLNSSSDLNSKYQELVNYLVFHSIKYWKDRLNIDLLYHSLIGSLYSAHASLNILQLLMELS